MDNEILKELNLFACGLEVAKKAREAEEARLWELILNKGSER